MPTLDDLNHIVSTLHNKEKKYIPKILTSELERRLFDRIIHGDYDSVDKLAESIKPQKLNKLIANLYDTVLEVPALGSCIKIPPIYSPINAAKMHVRKNLLRVQYLTGQSQFRLATQLHEANVALAIKFELYDELLIMLYDLDNLYAALQDYQKFKKNKELIKYYEPIRIISKRAFHIFNRNGIENSVFSDNRTVLREQKKDIALLDKYYHKSKSYYVKWVYYRILIAHNETNQNYLTAYSKACELLELTKHSPSICSNGYLAFANKLCSKYLLCLYNFEQALTSISIAKKLDVSKHNYNLSLGNEFYIYYHQGQYEKAGMVLKELNQPNDAFTKSTIEYYKACLSIFMPTKYNMQEIVTQTKEIEKDKEGWNIHVRIVQILSHLESKKNDVAKAHVESLRKHIGRCKAREISPRLLLILKVLRELVKNDFSYIETWNKKFAYFEFLSSEKNSDYSWRLLSPELIRFDVWFEAKARRLSYQTIFNERIENRR